MYYAIHSTKIIFKERIVSSSGRIKNYLAGHFHHLARKKKILIGRRDFIDFPTLGLKGVKAKIDTGADTSSIHVRKIRLEEKKGGQILTCYFRPRHKTVFDSFQTKTVKSSNGIRQERFVVSLTVVVFGREFETEFTLSDRKDMSHPVLLGKRFLRGRFVVDVGASNLSFKNKLREV